MKLRFLALFIAIVFLSTSLPTSVAKAGKLPYLEPEFIHVSFCGSQISYESTDFPAYGVFFLYSYPADEGSLEVFKVATTNAQTRDTVSPIGYVNVTWGHGEVSDAYFTVDSPSCPEENPAYPKLIDMYVYYSAIPFFGDTHTITIYSAHGFPSKESVKRLAGGALPDGFAYGAPACWAGLFDDGGKGMFECDSFLAGVGERRAWLRNDPEGPKFDLLPKILRYLEAIKKE
jgi:hypothetical protein